MEVERPLALDLREEFLGPFGGKSAAQLSHLGLRDSLLELAALEPPALLEEAPDPPEQLDEGAIARHGTHDQQSDAFDARSCSIVDPSGQFDIGDHECLRRGEVLQAGPVSAVDSGRLVGVHLGVVAVHQLGEPVSLCDEVRD